MRKMYAPILIVLVVILIAVAGETLAARRALANLYADRPTLSCTDSDVPSRFSIIQRKRQVIMHYYASDYLERTKTPPMSLQSLSARAFSEIAVAHLIDASETEDYFQRTPCRFRHRSVRR